MKKILKEFKDFAMKGNVIDMAVGITLGTAFNDIVNSLVNDIIMPFIAAISSDTNFTSFKFILKQTDKEIISVNYGQFIQIVVNFLIIAFSMWVVVRLINKVKKKILIQEKTPAKSPELLQLERITQLLESK